MVRTIAAITIVLGSTGRAVDAQCEASAPVRQIIERSYLRQESGLSAPEQKARRVAILEEGLAGHPDDYFLLRQEMNAENGYEPRLRWAKALREKHPDRPVYALLHAQAPGRNRHAQGHPDARGAESRPSGDGARAPGGGACGACGEIQGQGPGRSGAFSLSDLEGKTWKLAALRGKALLINVWATWWAVSRPT